MTGIQFPILYINYIYIVLVGWLFREFDISRIELDCKNCESYKVFLWGNRMDENNKCDQNHKNSLARMRGHVHVFYR